MNKRVNKCETSYDVRKHQRNTLLCMPVISTPVQVKDDLSRQQVKMPGLLRLNSVGEVSSWSDPAENKTYSGVAAKPSQHKSFTALSKLLSNMASVKSLTPSSYSGQYAPVPRFTKSYSFSEVLQRTGPGQYHSDKKENLSFDSHPVSSRKFYKSSLTGNRDNNIRRMFSYPSSNAIPANPDNIDVLTLDNIKNMTCPDFTSLARKSLKVPLESVILSAIASCPVVNASSSPDKDRRDLPCTSINSSSQPKQMPINCQKSCDIVQYPLPVNHLAASQILQNGDSIETFNTTVSMLSDLDMKSNDELCSSPQECKTPLDTKGHSKSAAKNNGEKKEFGSKNASHCPLKQVINFSSVLCTPRKTTKKGRPTSKKQRKRQREKQKQIFQSSSTDDYSGKTTLESLSTEEESFGMGLSSSLLHSPHKASTPVKVQSNCTALLSHSVKPDSEDTEEIDDSGDIEESSSSWSAANSFERCISPINGCSFNIAIFKQKSIPSLKSVLNVEDSDSDSEPSTSSPCAKKSLFFSLSEDDSFDTNFECSASSPFTDNTLFHFSAGLCIDNLLTKKPGSENQNPVHLKACIQDLVFSFSDKECNNLISKSAEECSDMNEINTKWNEGYPSAGFRSCSSVFSDTIKDPSVKVQFAQEPDLITVYEVGTEDRAGTWHYFALDRERFERRIQEVTSIIAPVLEANHRAKILERNMCCERKFEQ